MKSLNIVFKEVYEEKKNIEAAISKLREHGASQIDCVKILIFELKIPLSKADEIVVNSTAWNDIKTEVIKLRNDIFENSLNL